MPGEEKKEGECRVNEGKERKKGKEKARKKKTRKGEKSTNYKTNYNAAMVKHLLFCYPPKSHVDLFLIKLGKWYKIE